jgi:hypothetical protein
MTSLPEPTLTEIINVPCLAMTIEFERLALRYVIPAADK